MNSKQKIFMVSLGCSKNRVDSENMLGLLEAEGLSVVSELKEAGVVIINTCGFIQEAVEETIDNILAAANKKKKGEIKRLYVTGCFVQRYGRKLANEIPEVDGWLGTGEIGRITDMLGKKSKESPPVFINRPVYLADHNTPRIRTTPFYSAYLKVAEGCSNKCSFCTIPALRGPFRSRKMESLVVEAEEMAGRGVKEINLIAQDTTMYGRDLDSGECIEDLLEKLLSIRELKWLRVLYGHPYRVSDRLLDLMEKEERICPYLDLPVQHVNQHLLKAMGRPIVGESPWQFIDRVKSRDRLISLRTTLMVGFPGETEEIFNELVSFVKKAEFDHLGTFIYSPEKGTHAARLEQTVERSVAEHRRDEIMGIQSDISLNKNQTMVGRTFPVLVEGVSPETDLLLTGRTAFMAPDVDGQVLINKGNATIGEIVQVRISEAHSYDLIGEIV